MTTSPEELARHRHGGGHEWLSIETVPKNGIDVLLWLGAAYARVEIARWAWRLERFVTPDEMSEIGSNLPTHWMPLPDPPKDATP